MSFLDDVLAMVRGRHVVYLREAQVLMEKPPDVDHWDVYNALVKLAQGGKLSTERKLKLRWYFDGAKTWEDVQQLATEKAQFARTYITYPNEFVSDPQGVRYDDYSEYLVEDALKQAGFLIFGKSTSYFGGRTYHRQGRAPGRPPDLDFTAGVDGCRVSVGVSVKNLLDYPKDDAVDQLLEMCEVLRLKPILVARMTSFRQVGRIRDAGGYTVIFKRWLLKPGMDRATFNKISDAGKSESVLGLPFSIYQYTPDFLVKKMQDASRAVLS